MSSNVKTNHTIFFQTTFYPLTYSKYERKICMQKCENDAEKLIRKITLKMIKTLHSIFSHFQLKNLKMYIYREENKKKKKNEHQNLIKKFFFFILFFQTMKMPF